MVSIATLADRVQLPNWGPKRQSFLSVEEYPTRPVPTRYNPRQQPCSNESADTKSLTG